MEIVLSINENEHLKVGDNQFGTLSLSHPVLCILKAIFRFFFNYIQSIAWTWR